MKTNYYTVKAVLRKDKIRNDGNCPLYIYFQRNGKTQKLSLAEVIPEKDWDKNNEQGLGTGYGDLNALIKKKKQNLEDFIRQNKCLGKDVLNSDISNFWNGKSINELDFYKFYETFCKRHFLTIRESTQIHYVTLGKKLKDFRPQLSFAEIDYAFMQKFTTYLIDTKSGRYNMIKFFKTALKEALRLKLTIDDSWKAVKNVSPKRREVFLTPKEIGLIEVCDLSMRKHLEITRNMFLFSCYTGMRFGDVSSFTKNDFKDNIIKIKQQKTGVYVEVPVNQKAKLIICKYIAKCKENESIFPNIKNQTVNRHLKKIANLCEIDKFLHFHIARHSFGTILMQNNINVFTISKIMGHKKLDQTYSYVGLNIKIAKEMMSTINFSTNP